MGVTPLAWLAAMCGIAVAAGVTVAATAVLAPHDDDDVRCAVVVAGGQRRPHCAAAAAPGGAHPDHPDASGIGGGCWPGSPPGSGCGRPRGWPVAGIAVAVVGVWSPWLMGSGRIARGEHRADRGARRRGAGGWPTPSPAAARVGLTQAITTSAGHAPDPIAAPVRRLAARIRAGDADQVGVLTEFADELDDRVADRSPPRSRWRCTSRAVE